MKTTAEEILKAKKALEDSRIVVDGNYDSVFNGYISSFGASLVQAGLLPTIIFFENEKSAAKDRPKVIVALKMLLGISNDKMTNYIISKEANSSIRRCDDPLFVKNVVQAMTAMKLALRMFNKK